jgi:hypothetical protein
MGQILEAIQSLTSFPNRRLRRDLLQQVAREILGGQAETGQIRRSKRLSM